jgi:hypothetical protein
MNCNQYTTAANTPLIHILCLRLSIYASIFSHILFVLTCLHALAGRLPASAPLSSFLTFGLDHSHRDFNGLLDRGKEEEKTQPQQPQQKHLSHEPAAQLASSLSSRPSTARSRFLRASSSGSSSVRLHRNSPERMPMDSRTNRLIAPAVVAAVA